MATAFFSKAMDKMVGGVISTLARTFPGGATSALPSYLARLNSGVVLAHVLGKTSIDSISVEGDQGNFEGSAADISVIQRYALDREWSTKLIARVQAFFAEKGAGTFFDVGANIGLTTVPVAASGAKVASFEPVPGNFAFLSRNVERNGVADRVHLHNVALMDAPGELVFELSPTNHGDHRARRGGEISLLSENLWETVKVAGRQLDDFEGEIEGPLALKIDTQGAEPLVIAGGRKVCDRAGLVFLEFSPYNMNRMQTDPQVMIDYIKGFPHILCFEGEDEDKARSVAPGEVEAYLQRYHESHKLATYGRYINLILTR